MSNNNSENRRSLAMLVLGGFFVVALAGLGASSTIASGFALAVVGNIAADLIVDAISKK